MSPIKFELYKFVNTINPYIFKSSLEHYVVSTTIQVAYDNQLQ